MAGTDVVGAGVSTGVDVVASGDDGGCAVVVVVVVVVVVGGGGGCWTMTIGGGGGGCSIHCALSGQSHLAAIRFHSKPSGQCWSVHTPCRHISKALQSCGIPRAGSKAQSSST